MKIKPQNLSLSGQQIWFQLVSSSMPLEISGITPAQQVEQYRTYKVMDNLGLPSGFNRKGKLG